MNFLSPAEIATAASSAGQKKSELSIGKMIVLGILAGAYIGFGANLAIVVGHDATLGAGVTQFLFGSVFSVGLMLVVIGGAELFTGNNMFLMISALDGKASWGGLMRNWVIVWIANFIGSLLLVYIVIGGFYYMQPDGTTASGMFSGAVGAKALLIAKGKLSAPWFAIFCRAILCNWLVCMAVWLALAGKDAVSKVFGIFFPIMAFVASGFEHSVANMFFIPIGIKVATIPAVVNAAKLTPDITNIVNWNNCIFSNLIPATLGNIVGGAFFVGCFYWYCYLQKPAVAVSNTKAKST
jgi:formate/nitrite transporter